MDQELLSGQMERNMKDSGRMAYNMGLGLFIKIVKIKKERMGIIKMVEELNVKNSERIKCIIMRPDDMI